MIEALLQLTFASTLCTVTTTNEAVEGAEVAIVTDVEDHEGPVPDVEGLELETDRPEVASPSAVACKDEGPAVLVSEGADEVVAGTVVDAVEGT